jgi:hypothetical protein
MTLQVQELWYRSSLHSNTTFTFRHVQTQRFHIQTCKPAITFKPHNKSLVTYNHSIWLGNNGTNMQPTEPIVFACSCLTQCDHTYMYSWMPPPQCAASLPIPNNQLHRGNIRNPWTAPSHRLVLSRLVAIQWSQLQSAHNDWYSITLKCMARLRTNRLKSIGWFNMHNDCWTWWFPEQHPRDHNCHTNATQPQRMIARQLLHSVFAGIATEKRNEQINGSWIRQHRFDLALHHRCTDVSEIRWLIVWLFVRKSFVGEYKSEYKSFVSWIPVQR